MASSTKEPISSSLPFPAYFSALAANYAKQTGNSTRLIFDATYFDVTSLLPIDNTSYVHDNAAGPGTATSVIVDRLTNNKTPSSSSNDLPKILITDNVPAMVSAATSSFASFPHVTAKECDSHNLNDASTADSVSHSIMNFSIFAMDDPLLSLREIYRTLKPGGVAVITTWKGFAAGDLIHTVQTAIRGDLPLMKIPHPEFCEMGVVKDLVVTAGFERGKVEETAKGVVIRGEDVEGLKGFLMSDFTKPARAGWSDEDVGRWGSTVEKVLHEETEKEGEVRFEAWVVLARK